MALHTVLVFSISWSSLLHEGLGFPVIIQSEGTGREPAHRVRTKRCSCNNELDSECHYFCHLDIIWVNTPSKIAVYGLGSPLARRSRSTGRCLCANSTDQTCNSFCVPSSETAAVMQKNLSELLQDKSENSTSDLQGAKNKQPSVAPAVLDIEETVDRTCANEHGRARS